MKKKTQSRQIFLENPYDIETVFEALSIASNKDKEFIYMDRLVSYLRMSPEEDLTSINFKILQDLNLLDQPTYQKQGD
jgi:hypothetical protein